MKTKTLFLDKRKLFYLGLFFVVLKTFTQITLVFQLIPSFLGDIFSIISVVFLLLSIMLQRPSIGKLSLFFCVFLLTLVSSFFVKEYLLLISVLCCYAGSFFDLREDILFFHKVKISLTVITVLISFFMLSIGKLSFDLDGDYKVFNFGFTHPNIFSGNILWIIGESLYLRKKHSYIYLFTLFVIFALVYVSTRSDIFLLCGLLFIILSGYLHYEKSSHRLFKLLTSLSFLLIGLFVLNGVKSIYSQDQNSLFFYNFDLSYLSGRLRLGAKELTIIESHSFSLFGQLAFRGDVMWDEYYRVNSVTIDGIYMSFGLQYGIVWFVVFSLGFFSLGMSKQSSSRINLLLLVYAIYGVAEVHCLIAIYAFPLFMILYHLFNARLVLFNCEKNTKHSSSLRLRY